MSKTSIIAAGIDTAKDKLDIALSVGKERLCVANQLSGWRQLSGWLRDSRIERVGIEASGGYERDVVAHLRQAGFVVLVLQPVQVKAYGRSKLRRAKNDQLDAVLIAKVAADQEPGQVRAPADARLLPLQDVLTALEQCEEDIARIKVRLEHVRDKSCVRTMRADIVRLKARRMALIKRLEAAVKRYPDLFRRLELVQSIEGIGLRTALVLIIRMPELGTLSREQAAALAGLAPFDNDSGKHSGARHIAGGRQRVRKSLYAAASAAALFWNSALKALYTRLNADGKAHVKAIVACARKLVIYANTVLQRQSPWIKQPIPQ